SELRRGDLVFWQRHVAIVRDAASLVHANAFHMAVAFEPIAQAIARIRARRSEGTRKRPARLPAAFALPPHGPAPPPCPPPPSPRAAGRGWPERSEGRVWGSLASDSTRNALQLRKNHGENALLVGQYVGIPEP